MCLMQITLSKNKQIFHSHIVSSKQNKWKRHPRIRNKQLNAILNDVYFEIISTEIEDRFNYIWSKCFFNCS